MSRELLTSAYLFILNETSSGYDNKGYRYDLLKRIESELAQPDPEPVAWISEALINRFIEIESKGRPLLSSRGYVTNRCLDEDKIPLYRSNSAMKRLSDEEIRAIGKDAFGIDLIFDGRLTEFAKAIEDALLEKNK